LTGPSDRIRLDLRAKPARSARVKHIIEQLVASALAALPTDVLPDDLRATTAVVERTRDPAHGDFACNVAMQLARPARKNPRQLAGAIVAALPASELVTQVQIAGPGFINFFLAPAAYQAEIGRVHEAGDAYGCGNSGGGRKAIVEFVSANPTGPLHVGHGRHAAFGATLANLLAAVGWQVHREYYVNDAGRQMDILAASVWLRYLELCDETFAFPANGYRGDYVRQIAAKLHTAEGTRLKVPAAEVFAALPADEPAGGDKDKYIDAVVERMRALLGPADFRRVFDLGLNDILKDIREDLAEFGVSYDRWYSERSLGDNGAIERALTRLTDQRRVYEQDGALWFRATEFGDEKDRVVVRENGQKTYFASDIAYHLDKRERGFDLLLDVLGADHHGYVARVRAGLEATGEPGESLEVRLVQFVSLFRGGEKVQMSTRSGEFITLRELRHEVGNDAARLFYVMRSNDQPLDFDLELAKSRSADNPVYYVQYAHARVASVLRQLRDRGFEFDRVAGLAALSRLEDPHEQALMTAITRWPEIVELAAAQRAPHMIVHYLRELATAFHAYYNALPFIVDDAALRNGRLVLVLAAQQVIRNGLAILGVSAPETM
jgi:arginyl-tRNA synthetase